jgi:ribosomal protein L11 methyltransferase
VLANVLARPLCLMVRSLAMHLAPGGPAIVAGLLANQVRQVLLADRRRGLRLEVVISEGPWMTLVLRPPRPQTPSLVGEVESGGVKRELPT